MFFGPPFLDQKLPRANPGPISKSRVQILVPRSKNGPPGPKTKKMRTEKPCRTPPPEFQMEPYGASYGQKPFWGKNGGWENMVLRGNGFENGDGGVSRDPNGLYGTQEAFGKASFPQNPFKTLFPSTFLNLGKFGECPPGPPVFPLLALCGPYRALQGSVAWPKANTITVDKHKMARLYRLLVATTGG